MKSINNDIFTSYYPHLDLHGEYASTADLLIKQFINDNVKMKKDYIVIVHGIGEGIIKALVWDICRHNPLVLEFKLNPNNIGSTIIKLKIE